MTPKERAVMQQALEALENYGIDGTKSVGGIKCTEAITALREALDHFRDATKKVAEPDTDTMLWDSVEPRKKAEQERMPITEPVVPWLSHKVAEQAEQEPVAETALKNCIYFDSIDFNQTPPYLRYDTGDSTPKENWTIYCDIQEDLRKNGYELTDSDVDHDTVCGDVTPIAAPVRTKDLTEEDINELWNTALMIADPTAGNLRFKFARAVIAADRELNK